MTPDAFWMFVDQTGGPNACWPWAGKTWPSGHGRVWFDGRSQQAHRVAFTLVRGPLPDGSFARHQCDNPPCCNPAHLIPGSHDENMADMASRGRASRHGGTARGDRNGSRLHPDRRPRGIDNRQARLTEEAVREMRRLYDAGGITTYQLADVYGVSQRTAYLVVARRAWTHIA